MPLYKLMYKLFLLLLLSAISLEGVAQVNSVGDLNVVIYGFKSQKGFVRALVFDQPEGYPGVRENSIQLLSLPVTADTVVITFKGLALNKKYAISLYHDKNSNKHFDSNFFGIPLEGYGVSNNVNVLRAPTFKEAEFMLTKPDQRVYIKMLHLF